MSSAAPVLLQGEDPCKSTASVALHEERRLTALQRWRGRKKAQSCPSAADGTNQPLSQSSPVVCSHKRARGVALQRLGDKRAKLSSSGRNSALPSGGVAVCENRGSNADGRSVAGSQAMHKEPGAVERGLIVRSGTVVRLRAGIRTYIRTINNQFAFTSLGVMYDKELSQRNNGVYTFRIQGRQRRRRTHHHLHRRCGGGCFQIQDALYCRCPRRRRQGRNCLRSSSSSMILLETTENPLSSASTS